MFLNFIEKKGYSILCLQDTHFITESEPIIESQWGYQCIFNSYKSNARGVCILFNNNFEFHIHNIKKDGEGNFLAVDLTIEETRVTLVNIYGPNSDQPGFYENIRNIFLELDNEYFILCGDFNLVLNPDIDTYNYKYINNPKAREKLLEIMDKDDSIFLEVLLMEIRGLFISYSSHTKIEREKIEISLSGK